MKRIGETRTRWLRGLILLGLVLGSVGACAHGQQGGPPQEPPTGIITPDHPASEGAVPTVLFFMGIAEDEPQTSIRMDKVAYVLGETGAIYFEINQPAYIYVWTVCPTAARIEQLFPNPYDTNNYFSAGNHTIPTPGRQYRLQAQPPEGWKWMQVMALSAPLPGVGSHANIPFPPLHLSPGDWSQQFLSWLGQQLPSGTGQAFNFTSYQIVGTPVVQYGTLRVTSNPAGAQVLVNGTPRGVTPQWQPFEILLAPGSYTVTVRLAGLQDYNTTVQVMAGGVQNVHADLMGGVAGQGGLRILSVPPGLGVYIGGTYRGLTPIEVSLPAGIHSVQLWSGLTPVWSRTVVVFPFVTQTITVALNGQPATGARISTDKAAYSVGETVVFTISSPTPCASAFFRVHKPDNTYVDTALPALVPGVTVRVSGGAGSPPGQRTVTLYCDYAAVAQTTFSVGGLVVCMYSINPASHTFADTGGAVSVAVNAPVGCTWMATSPCPWVTVSPGFGTGPGTVFVTAQPRPSPLPGMPPLGTRTCTLTIAGREFAVTQGSPFPVLCTFSITPTEASFNRFGGTVVVSVTTQANCSWTATSPCPWVTVSPSSGTGSRTVTVTVERNDALILTRFCTVTIAGKEFTVTQRRN